MKFLDGFKTIIGIAGTIVTVAIPKLDPSVVQAVGEHSVAVAQGVFGLLAVLGVIHKREKARAK